MLRREVLWLLFMLGVFKNGLTSLIQTQQTVVVAAGGQALLNCQLIQSKEVLQVTWQKLVPEGKTDIATYSKHFGQRVNAGFEEKVKFKDAGLQSSSIVIRNVMEKDEGCYQCLSNTYPDGALIGKTCLHYILGLTALIQTQQTVFAAVGDEALLNCHLIQFKDAQKVTWRKLSPEGEENLTSYGRDFSQKVNPDFKDKLELKDAGLQNSSIIIKKVTEQDEACYNCSFTYPEGALTNTTCLKVHGFERSRSHNSGFYFIVPLMVAVSIVAAVVLFKHKQNKKTRKNKCSLSLRKSEEIEMDETIKDNHDLSHRNSDENEMDKDSNESQIPVMSQEGTKELTPEKNEESDKPKCLVPPSRRLDFDQCE